MEHGERRGAQAIERGDAVEIADDRDDPVRAELRDLLATADESVQARATREQRGNAERDVSTANQQYPDHEPAVVACRPGKRSGRCLNKPDADYHKAQRSRV